MITGGAAPPRWPDGPDHGRRTIVLVIEDDADANKAFSETVSLLENPAGSRFAVLGLLPPLNIYQASFYNLPDVVLVDLMLNGRLNGIELTSVLKTHHHITCPCIAMSGSRQMLGIARESGLFDVVLEKPFELGTLARVILESVALALPHDDPRWSIPPAQ